MTSPSSDLNTPAWLRPTPEGVILLLLIQPRASRTEVVGAHGTPPRLKVRVAAPPVDNEANEEVVRFLAKRLKVPKSHIHLIRGESSKQKDLLIQGISESAVAGLEENK